MKLGDLQWAGIRFGRKTAMKVLKVKWKHLDFDTRGIRLSKRFAATVAKHNYKHVQIDGKIYPITYNYVMPKSKGYLPLVWVDESLLDVYQDSNWYKNLGC